jgi:peptide chain release factor 1
MDIQAFRDNPRTAYLAVEYDRLAARVAEAEALATADASLAELALEEARNFKNLQAQLWTEMTTIAASADKPAVATADPSLILEVRAGAGGDESALFARELAEMYHRYAESRGWSFVLVVIRKRPSRSRARGLTLICVTKRGFIAFNAFR